MCAKALVLYDISASSLRLRRTGRWSQRWKAWSPDKQTTHELYSRLRSQRSHLNLTFPREGGYPPRATVSQPLTNHCSVTSCCGRERNIRNRSHRGEVPSSLSFDLRGDYRHCVPAQNCSIVAASNTANTSTPARQQDRPVGAQAGRHSVRRRRTVPAHTVPSRTLRTPALWSCASTAVFSPTYTSATRTRDSTRGR